MKVLIPILIGLVVVGCGKKQSVNTNESNNTSVEPAKQKVEKATPSKGDDKNTTKAKPATKAALKQPAKELTLEEKVVGVYEWDGEKVGFLENGKFKAYGNVTNEEGTWKIVGKEVHVDDKSGVIVVLKIGTNDDLTLKGLIKDGKRKDVPKEEQVTFKKISHDAKTATTGKNVETNGDNGKPEPIATSAKPTKEQTLEERKLVGCYEKIIRLPDGSEPHSFTNKLVLFENGKVESYENGKWGGHFRFATEWNKVKKEVHVFEDPNTAAIFKIEPNGDLTYFSEINLGMRVGMPKKYHDTFKKTSEKPKPRKVVPANIGNPILEKEIREELNKPKGELTEADLEKVGALSLQRNQLTEVPKELEKLTELWALDLNDNKLTEVPKGLEKLTKLTQLDLQNNRLTSVKGLEKFPQLYFLSLSGNRMTDVKGLDKLPKLHTLYLNDNKLTEVPKGLEKLTKLLKLYLRDNKLTDVKGLEKLTQLGELQLENNQLTNVKGLEKLTQLTVLQLAGNKLTDVKGLEKLTKLGLLSLNDNQLTDVKGLEKPTWLRYLSLQDNPDLTKAQIAELQKALPNCRIISNPTK